MQGHAQNIRPNLAMLNNIKIIIINWHNKREKKLDLEYLDQLLTYANTRLEAEIIQATLESGVNVLARIIYNGLFVDYPEFVKDFESWLEYYKTLEQRDTRQRLDQLEERNNIMRSLDKRLATAYTVLGDDLDLMTAMEKYIVNINKVQQFLANQHYILYPVPITLSAGESEITDSVVTLSDRLLEVIRKSNNAENVHVAIPLNIAHAHWIYLRVEISHGNIVSATLVDSLKVSYSTQARHNVARALRIVDPNLQNLEIITTGEQYNGHSCLDHVCRYMLMDLTANVIGDDRHALRLVRTADEREMRAALIGMIVANRQQQHTVRHCEERSEEATQPTPIPAATLEAGLLRRAPVSAAPRNDVFIETWAQLAELLKNTDPSDRVDVFYNNLRNIREKQTGFAALLPLFTKRNCWGIVQNNARLVTEANILEIIPHIEFEYQPTLLQIISREILSKEDTCIGMLPHLCPAMQFKVANRFLDRERPQVYVKILSQISTKEPRRHIEISYKIISMLSEHLSKFKKDAMAKRLLENVRYSPSLLEVAKMINSVLSLVIHITDVDKPKLFDREKIRSFRDYKQVVMLSAALLGSVGYEMNLPETFDLPLEDGVNIKVTQRK